MLEFPVPTSLDDLERHMILATVALFEQNRTKAAEALGITTKTLRNKLNRYRAEGRI